MNDERYYLLHYNSHYMHCLLPFPVGCCYSNPYYGSDDEYRLVRDLMKSYNKQVRPSLYNNQPLNVSYGVALAQIIDLVRS